MFSDVSSDHQLKYGSDAGFGSIATRSSTDLWSIGLVNRIVKPYRSAF